MDFIQYWHSGNPPSEVLQRMASVRACNHSHDHLMFDDKTAADYIRERFSEREEKAYSNCLVPAMKCDYFRYCILGLSGGAYVDADFRCLEPFAPLFCISLGPVLFKRRNGHLPNGLMIVPKPQDPLMAFATHVATLNIERRIIPSVWAATGPGILTTLYALATLGLDGFVESFPERPAWTHPWLLHLADLILVETGGRPSDLLKGVTILPVEEMDRFVTEDPAPLYKSGADYWANWQGSIYGNII